ncbi:hypothetical protein TWF481_008713 [Arthrobotrys musiformis]|uniref:DUF4246 domain-containing protein n=1 Tax=Arthrobotrys musiformis TaxID=47236 RepID=A0AAV9W9Z6_9PEZI
MFVWNETSKYREFVENHRAKGSHLEPDIDGVWRADGAVDEGTRRELIDAVSELETVHNPEQYWRPLCDGMVLDLVDPTLWPAIYGRTMDETLGGLLKIPDSCFQLPKCFRLMGATEIDPNINDKKVIKWGFSSSFSLLPAEFEISADETRTTIKSYINNLSTPHQQIIFYPIIERIFTASIPLFEHALADLTREWYHSPRAGGCFHEVRHDLDVPLQMKRPETGITFSDYIRKAEEILSQFENGEPITAEYSKDAKGICYRHASCRKTGRDCGKICHKDHAVFLRTGEEVLDEKNMWTPPSLDRAHKFGGRTLKVIVRLTNIMLTPDNPRFPGFNWHIIPTLNESVIATGIYYYSEENITPAGIKLKPMKREEFLVGCRCGRSDPEFDRSERQNRIVVFPNMLKSKFEPFELVDKTLAGHQKILVFYLCDPSLANDVPTTRIVSPQQPGSTNYVMNQWLNVFDDKHAERFSRIMNLNSMEYISREEAEEYRMKYFQDRTRFLPPSIHD